MTLAVLLPERRPSLCSAPRYWFSPAPSALSLRVPTCPPGGSISALGLFCPCLSRPGLTYVTPVSDHSAQPETLRSNTCP